MNLAQTIQQHMANFPPEKQAEVLDFVLFLEKKLMQRAPAPHAISAINRIFGSYADSLSSSEEFARRKQQEIEQEEAKWQRR